jgi:hypothetical protein
MVVALLLALGFLVFLILLLAVLFLMLPLERVKRGWRLGMKALGIIRRDKQLLLFPLLSSFALILVLLSFALPLILTQSLPTLLQLSGDDSTMSQAASKVLEYVVLFAFYFCNYFVIVFFNTGLIACALKRFDGKRPTLGYGFKIAFRRLPHILLWSLVSATVGLLLNMISERSGKVGKIISEILGGAWSVLTFFVVPVLVVERVGPFAAIKRSWAVLKKTWGESLVANFGVGLILFFATLIALLPGVLGILLGVLISPVAAFIGIGITLLLVLTLSLISSAAHTIIAAALYDYATEDRIPKGFKGVGLRNAFMAVQRTGP